MVPHNDPTEQPDFPTDDFQDIGTISPDTSSDNTGTSSGTNVPRKAVPIIINYIVSCALWPDNDPESPGCPTCGRPPFDVRLSGLLDLAILAHEALSVLKNALEEEVLP